MHLNHVHSEMYNKNKSQVPQILFAVTMVTNLQKCFSYERYIILYNLYISSDLLEKEENTEVLECLAEIAGPLACVVSRKALLKQPTDIVRDKLAWQAVKISCTSCNNLEGDSSSS